MALRGRKPPFSSDDEKVVEINAQMQGSITFKDSVSLKINGEFNGTLETKGTLSIGGTANVVANISGDNIIIAGKVTGDILAHKLLTLMPTAVLRGNISTPKLNIVDGAIFQGKCQMAEWPEKSEGDLLDLEEVAKYLEIDSDEITTLANSGQIPGTKAGNSWKFERAKIDHWAASGRIK